MWFHSPLACHLPENGEHFLNVWIWVSGKMVTWSHMPVLEGTAIQKKSRADLGTLKRSMNSETSSPWKKGRWGQNVTGSCWQLMGVHYGECWGDQETWGCTQGDNKGRKSPLLALHSSERGWQSSAWWHLRRSSFHARLRSAYSLLALSN